MVSVYDMRVKCHRANYCLDVRSLFVQYEKRFEKDDREKGRRKAREAMSDKIRMKIEFRQQVGAPKTVAKYSLALWVDDECFVLCFFAV